MDGKKVPRFRLQNDAFLDLLYEMIGERVRGKSVSICVEWKC